MTITVSAEIEASITKVWDYYTNAQHITQWNFATDEWHCPHASTDLRPGGKHMARMEAKDGSFGFDFEAIYDEVVPNQKLSYTMGDGRQASIIFNSQDDDTTVVTITFDADDNSIDLQQQGWQSILNNFKRYVESH